ncbi:hypothetical protein Trco_007799 [Trichoderma cornu-damae]|uniref:Uncharacterized protein n=1 Tax=Trichoderma cornu-damae TaxID=654480 RepID=A0A9P8QJV7_9HYPO|nr:hypothetical protein Trco_007799 [Trichoderma cornu-damae]
MTLRAPLPHAIAESSATTGACLEIARPCGPEAPRLFGCAGIPGVGDVCVLASRVFVSLQDGMASLEDVVAMVASISRRVSRRRRSVHGGLGFFQKME